ncbi:hypothetical protein FN846DRAFT_926392 [Sphaerosporella brunnea]|uniref:Uncharacterized protein n=1 Tax=Sphaerosporella brunnea TaxID=1250544 RepID=A0A5J5FA87_9PEZI|nr:hypothetical protein FN846DRAFT_926392 [Sphaerosporella brunnea]
MLFNLPPLDGNWSRSNPVTPFDQKNYLPSHLLEGIALIVSGWGERITPIDKHSLDISPKIVQAPLPAWRLGGYCWMRVIYVQAAETETHHIARRRLLSGVPSRDAAGISWLWWCSYIKTYLSTCRSFSSSRVRVYNWSAFPATRSSRVSLKMLLLPNMARETQEAAHGTCEDTLNWQC